MPAKPNGRRRFWAISFWRNDNEFYQKAALAPRSNCLLNPSKLVTSGIKMRDVETALEDSIRHWAD
jgi:hypothetical protein